MKVKTTFALFCLAVFLFGSAPITQTTDPRTSSARLLQQPHQLRRQLQLPPATETATPTATEAPTYNVCPPETTDPAEMSIGLKQKF